MAGKFLEDHLGVHADYVVLERILKDEEMRRIVSDSYAQHHCMTWQPHYADHGYNHSDRYFLGTILGMPNASRTGIFQTDHAAHALLLRDALARAQQRLHLRVQSSKDGGLIVEDWN